MLHRPGSPGGNDRDGHPLRHRRSERIVVARLGSVAVHAGEKNLPGAQTIRPLSPLQGVNPSVQASAVLKNVPAGSVRPALGVDGCHHALAAEFFRSLRNEAGIVNGCGVDGYLVRPGPQKKLKILHGPYAAAHSKGDEHGPGHLAHHIHHRLSVV